MSYPVQWLDLTFKSRQRAEQLLRPDLDSGLITEHDYRLATSFLPANHRYWPVAYATGISTAVSAYGYYLRKPRWSPVRNGLLTLGAGLAGSLYGQLRRARAHITFARLLDDPVSFSKALENVNLRTGGTEPLGWSLARVHEVRQHQQPQGPDENGDMPQPDEGVWSEAPESGVLPSPSARVQSLPPRSAPASQKPPSRWDDIRTANRNVGKPSSWDVLRQTHERERVRGGAEPGGGDAPEDEHAREQARFDAMLEAERRLSRG